MEEKYRNLNYIVRDPGYIEASENLCNNWDDISDAYQVSSLGGLKGSVVRW